ncbi:common pilus major fimbrillin subunit EcpA [Burkholderia territorii]|uniref:common pilus major fimbrillin subunit EcpA n=1 Tax=Burkholderia territorii TaxID=1503055 RepID=UPI000756C989|nr:common pilus major fimbrillin subunit EcpA [Burkholderia territorii]KVL47129.1 hypothetical protein WT00_26175 [Burkholderia territorii]
MKKNAIRLAVVSALAVVYAVPAIAETVGPEEARVKWTASVVKKSDVTLNVFAEGNTALDFEWNPASQAFSTQDRTLTVLASGYQGGTGYKIQAQVMKDTLNATAGGVKDSLKVGVNLGGIQLDQNLTDILSGTSANAAPTIAANGLQNMNLAKAGPNKTPNGSYHQANGVPVKFSITEGTDKDGKALSGATLSEISDGRYDGDVEVRFVASWEKPSA